MYIWTSSTPVVLDDSEDDNHDDDDFNDDDDTKDDDGPVSIDINYSRPNTTQKSIESKLPLPAWATQDKLLSHMKKQEGRRGSAIFDTVNITVDLEDIFPPPSRKRKISTQAQGNGKRRKLN